MRLAQLLSYLQSLIFNGRARDLAPWPLERVNRDLEAIRHGDHTRHA